MLRQRWLYYTALFCVGMAACTHRPDDALKSSSSVQSVEVQTSQIQNLNQASRQQKNLKQSLVRLRIKNANGEDSFGTGFFFKNRNLLVTALHTLDKNPCIDTGVCEIIIGLVKNSTTVHETTVAAKIALRDPSSDLLFLEIKDEPVLAQIIPLQKSAYPEKEQITAVGFYQDSQALTFSHGTSKIQDDKLLKSDENVSTIIVSQGFSGAPVVNTKGEVVGVVSSYHPLVNNKDIGIARFVDVK